MPTITQRIVTARSPKRIALRRRQDKEAGIQQSRPYYTLVERDDAKSPWTIQFGDYDKGTVQFELDDRRDHGARAKNLMIICTGNLAKDVTEAVHKLNGAK